MNPVLILPLLSGIAFASIATAQPAKRAQPVHAAKVSGHTSTTHRPGAAHHRHPVDRRSLGTVAVASANRAATLEPVSHGFAHAVQVFPYAQGSLFQVITAPERVTDIELQPGETLGAVASGDTARWVIGDTTSGSGAGKRTHVLVKPIAAGLSTNLVITTDKRTYHLVLTSNEGTALAAVSWRYPHDELIALERQQAGQAATTPVAGGIEVNRLHFNYAISGDKPDWRPLRAFDDGRQTFIEFPATLVVGEAPPLFLVDSDGKAELVNYRLRGHFYVVDRLFDAAELRLGAKHQQVVRISRRRGS